MAEATFGASLTMRQDHVDRLRSLILPPGGHEGAALLLAGVGQIAADPWNGRPHRRYLSRAVVEIDAEDLVETSPGHVTTRTRSLARLLRRARDEGLIAGYAHSHPGGPPSFSLQDDADEPYMAQLARNRNGTDTPFLSLLMNGDGQLLGRVWTAAQSPVPFEAVRVNGERLHLHYPDRLTGTTPEAFSRQALAFGPALTSDIGELRFGVVGAGATGSATAVLLARLGARRIALFDADKVDESNLSRLHGARRADIGRLKVDVLKEHLEAFGLRAYVQACPAWIGDPSLRDALLSCDILFGCTDDNEGRMLLNRLAYFYLIPVIDMGIDIGVGEYGIIGADARVTVLQPHTRCLLCRKVIDPQRAYEEQLERSDPKEYARRAEEKYVRGGGNPNPAVIHLTTDVATMAVDELIHRLTGYRRRGAMQHRVRKLLLLEDKTPGSPLRDYCAICGVDTYWGRGDVTPFLDRVG